LQEINYQLIIKEINNEIKCHTFILYGSRVNNTFNIDSDIDILCIKDKGESYQYSKVINGYFVDAWVNNIYDLSNTPDFLKILGGKVLIEKNNIGTKILEDVKSMYQNTSTGFSDLEINNLKLWSDKMLNRAKKLDPEGNFRKIWLANDLLELYFNVRNIWYLGSKKSFIWFKNNDLESYHLFDNLYKNPTLENLELVKNKVFENL